MSTRVNLQEKFIEKAVDAMPERILKFYATMALNDCYTSMSDEEFIDFIMKRLTNGNIHTERLGQQ